MRTALITGSSRGIGREIALTFAKAGYNVIINYKENEKAANEVLDLCGKFSRVIKIKTDVRFENQVKELYNKSREVFGFIDTVINNAGIHNTKLLIDNTLDEYNEVLDTNLKGAFLVSREFLPDMLKNRFGRLINISSIFGVSGASSETIYSASKAGLIGLTKALSKEYAPMGITVNAIAPGLIDTDMIKDVPKDVMERLTNNIMVGRVGLPKDVANIAEFLAKRESEYISGQVFGVNGEWEGVEL
jgi:3-oxoacyl-[acyl-carrier protein] reductase